MENLEYVGFESEYFEVRRMTSVRFSHNGEDYLADILVTEESSMRNNGDTSYSAELMNPEDLPKELTKEDEAKLLEVAICGIECEEDEDINLVV